MGNFKEKNDVILKSLGYHLRIIRQEKQLRQKTIAKLCDMDSGSYSNIENGKRNITILTLFKISKVLNVSMSELMSFKLKK
ncbi:MAG: helix-turn-helix transcriptional regulator [Flavobacteriaceae bacterium]|nr:helix-turn-helix transcriptional regulator [Formosa sp.]MDG2498920.1 helix-turn-helix transcriptional regulator [Flavobacteriaceae bacterium]